MEEVIKCVVVGDPKIGKTDLLEKFSRGRYIPASYQTGPITSYEHCNAEGLTVDGEPYSLRLFDTGSLDDSLPLRRHLYPNTDIFLICFSVVVPSSFESVKTKWLPEIHLDCPKAKFLIVGLQSDLRHTLKGTYANHGSRLITTEDGNNLAKELGALKYIECSTHSTHAHHGVKRVFDEAILALMRADGRHYTDNKQTACSIL